jgi:hypothetical protein
MKNARKLTPSREVRAPPPPETKDLPVTPAPGPGPTPGDLASIIRSAAMLSTAPPGPTPVVPEGKDPP